MSCRHRHRRKYRARIARRRELFWDDLIGPLARDPYLVRYLGTRDEPWIGFRCYDLPKEAP